MNKIPTLFKRNYDSDYLVRNEVIEGCEWVLGGGGFATIKYDGTCCMVRDGILYKRYERKLTKAAARRKRKERDWVPQSENYKDAPEGWEPAEEGPNPHTGHWPGWLPVDFTAPEDQWHTEAFDDVGFQLPDGTYELVGPKIQGNPYNLDRHSLWMHGKVFRGWVPRTFEGLKLFFAEVFIEGIVWWHPDGRKAKIKRTDFGFDWPVRRDE